MSAEPVSLAELERRSEDVLDPATCAFLACGAGDEHALHANRAAFERRALRPRVLVDVNSRSTRTSVLGQEVALPVLVVPVGFQTLLHGDGELAAARAAARCGTVMCVSTISEASPAEIAASVPEARLWFQVYSLRDRRLLADLIVQSAEAGFETIVLTVDGPIVSNHGGRQLDAAPRALDALPEFVAAVCGEAEVLVDDGIRRGTDVLVALALGARSVLIGRPATWGLAAGGEQGVAQVLRLLRAELDDALALCGCCSPADAVPAMVGEAR